MTFDEEVKITLQDKLIDALRVAQRTFRRLNEEDKTIYPKIKDAWEYSCIVLAEAEAL